MAGMRMETALRYLKRSLDSAGGRIVDIRLPGGESIEGIEAVPVTAQFDAVTTEEFSSSAQTFHWIVKTTDLIANGVRVEPETGWEIWDLSEEGTYSIYRAQPEGESRAYDLEDQYGILCTIHTKLDRVVPA
jgi:hypothetical protein